MVRLPPFWSWWLHPVVLAALTSKAGRIVFSSDRDGNPEIYVMDVGDDGTVRLTHNNAFDGTPDWSADRSRIVFERSSTSIGSPGPFVRIDRGRVA
jgi:Tol biopolymer transport system component